MEYAKDLFLESLDRCLENKEFIPAFYDQLLSKSDEIRERFSLVDMQKQKQILADSLVICAQSVEGKPEALAHLNEIGHSHDKYHLNILPEWYPIWIDAIVATASQFDPDWSEDFEQAWRKLLSFVTKRISSKYDA